jgi:nucleotide-binding universal stress UspA family protein
MGDRQPHRGPVTGGIVARSRGDDMDASTGWPILVGIDGSDIALDAARWAAAEAGRRDMPVRLVAAVPWSMFQPIGLPHLGQEYARDAALRVAQDHLARARAEVERTLPAARVDHEVRGGNPAEVLYEESARAGLLVLGNRGRGGFAGLLAGSVSTTLAAAAACPVVVYRGPSVPDGPVVVGVDGSPDGDAALEFAFEEARLRGAELVAVHAWSVDVFDPAVGSLLDRPAFEHRESEVLAGTLAAWQAKYPEVIARPRLSADRPAAALVAESGAAQLLVVGSRGHGQVAGLLLGSVSQATVHHSHCPVAVVRRAGTDTRASAV